MTCSPRQSEIDKVVQRLREFRTVRAWGKYHTPMNLVQALAVEVGELQELFLWGAVPSIDRVSDVLNLCDVLGIDLVAVIDDKIGVNASRQWAEDEWGRQR
jgi:NTP pyrophosphatase (non-canonical NTP hydrolase)